MKRVNPSCVCSNEAATYCYAVTTPEYGCALGQCPFYKTEAQNRVEEARCRKRCEFLDIRFISRDEVIREGQTDWAKYQKYKKPREDGRLKKITMYNMRDDIYIEYNSMEAACHANGLSRDKLIALIKKDEEWHGYRFVYS